MKILISSCCLVAAPPCSGGLVPSAQQQGEGKRQTTTNGNHTHTFRNGPSGSLLAPKIPGRLRRVLLLLLLRTNFSKSHPGQPFYGTPAKLTTFYNNMSSTIESTYRNIQHAIVTALTQLLFCAICFLHQSSVSFGFTRPLSAHLF